MKVKIANEICDIVLLSKIIFTKDIYENKSYYDPITFQFDNTLNVKLLEDTNTIEIISYKPNTNAIIVFDGYEIEDNFVKLNPVKYCSILTN